MNTELVEKIKKDLQKSGFASEMKAGQICNLAGWETRHSQGYVDKDSGSFRDTDLVARYQSDSTNARAVLYLHMELKKSEKPWLSFIETKDNLAGKGWVGARRQFGVPAGSGTATKYSNAMTPFSLAKKNGFVGIGVHEFFKDPREEGPFFRAAVTACKAAVTFIDDNFPESSKNDQFENDKATAITSVPVVVLDGILCSAELDEESNIQIEEQSALSMKFSFASKNYGGKGYQSVDLVALSALSEYLKLKKKQVMALSLEISNQRDSTA